MIPISDMLAFVAQDLRRKTPPLGVYWYECRQRRQQTAADMREAATDDVCLIPLIPERGFNNPNALLNDFVELLNTERARIEGDIGKAANAHRAIGLIVVSRTPLDEPLIASPILLPLWFPYGGGEVLDIDIIDLSASACLTLLSQADSIAKVQALLYEIQGLLLTLLTTVKARDHNKSSKLLQDLLKDGEKADEFLRVAAMRHSSTSADGFRVSTSPAAGELLGRIVARVGERSPNQLPVFAAGLLEALSLDVDKLRDIPEPLFAVCFRSTFKEKEAIKSQRCMRNVLLTLYASAQTVTALAHSAEYGEFSVLAMRGVVQEHITVLAAFRTLLLDTVATSGPALRASPP